MVAQADTVTFTGHAGTTDWNTAGNWSPARVPTQSDDVTIPSDKTVTNKPFAALGTGFINSLTLLGMLTIDTSSLTLQSTKTPSTINRLTLTSTQGQYSTLTMQGPTMFKGNLVLSPGVVNGNGAATIKGPVTASNGSSLGPASVDNQAPITVTGGGSQVTLGNVSFTNGKNGSITLQDDGIIIRGNGSFTNSGSITKSTGTFTSTFSPGSSPFSNSGTIEAQSGTLLLLINGTNTGTFNAASGATLEFSNTVTLNLGTTFGGDGTIDISAGGVWDVEAPVTVNTTTMAFDGGETTTIRGSSNLTIKSTTVNWNSGVLGADTGQLTLPEGVTMNIVTAGYHGLAMNLDLSGTVNMSADLQLSVPTITIEPGAHFNILTDNGIHGSGGTINNGGTFQKTQGTRTSTLDYGGTFNILPTDSDPVTVDTGTLDFHVNGGGTLGGTWTVGEDATVEFSLGNYSLPAGSKFVGGFSTELTGANWALTGKGVSVSTYAFLMFSGSISGAFDLTLLSHDIQLTGTRTGEIQKGKPVGTIKIPKKSSFVQIDDTFTLDACTLVNTSSNFYIHGSVVIQDSAILLNKGGTIILEVAEGKNTPAIQLSGGTFSNLGTVTLKSEKGVNPTQTIAGAPWDNSGNLTVPNSSTLNLPQGYVNLGGAKTIAGGTIIVGDTTDLEGGTLDGTGSIDGSGGINDKGANIEAGSETPGSGTGILSLNVPLTQGAGAAITALISGTKAGKQYDQINSTSSITLGGTLNLKFGNGFTPTPSDSFDILNFSSVTGKFSTVNAPIGWTAHLKFTATALNVQFTRNGVSISINPKAAMVKANGMTQFTGTVVGASKHDAKWSVKENGGGTVTQTGLYTAPATPGIYHLVVSSVADTTKSDTATVTVTALDADKLTVTPQAAVLQPGAILRLQANQSVAWSVAEGRVGGSVTAGGRYTAPQTPGLYHVVAAGAEGSNHTVANIAVTRGKLEFAYVAQPNKNAVSVLAGITGDGLTTGPLQETESLVAGQGPVALAISPDGTLLLSANQNSNDISLFALLHGDGVLSVLPRGSFAAGAQPSSVTFDPTGRFVFVTNKESDDFSVFSVDASGQLIFLRSHAFAAGDKPSAIAVHPDGSAVYVTQAGTNTVQGFAYDAAGVLRPLSGSLSATGTSPSAAVIDSAGKFLFVANRGSGDVSAFAIDVKNETLREVKGSPFKTGKGAAAIVIDLTGSYLFVADHQANDIASLQIDSETGALTLLGRTPLLNAGPSALAVDPSGQYLHVTSDKTGGVTTLKLDVATGTLVPAGETTARGKASSIVLGSATGTTQGP